MEEEPGDEREEMQDLKPNLREKAMGAKH